MKEKYTLLAQVWVMIYITGAFNFYEKNKSFIDSILVNKLQDW